MSGNYAHHLLWSSTAPCGAASTTFQNVGRTFNILFRIYVHVANAVLPLFFDLFFYIVLFSSTLTEYKDEFKKHILTPLFITSWALSAVGGTQHDAKVIQNSAQGGARPTKVIPK